MISSSDFTCFSSVAGCLDTLSTPGRSAPAVDPPGQRSIGKADLVAATAQFAWPPAFSFLAVSVQDLTAADTLTAESRAGADADRASSSSGLYAGRRSLCVTSGPAADPSASGTCEHWHGAPHSSLLPRSSLTRGVGGHCRCAE